MKILEEKVNVNETNKTLFKTDKRQAMFLFQFSMKAFSFQTKLDFGS